MRALILVDLQNDFMPGGIDPMTPRRELVQDIQRVLPHFDYVGGITLTNDEYAGECAFPSLANLLQLSLTRAEVGDFRMLGTQLRAAGATEAYLSGLSPLRQLSQCALELSSQGLMTSFVLELCECRPLTPEADSAIDEICERMEINHVSIQDVIGGVWPTLVSERVEKMKLLVANHQSLNDGEVDMYLSMILKGHRNRGRRVRAGTKLFRGRKTRGERWSTISALQAPPPECCTSYQRASRPGTSVFYASCTSELIPFECDVKVGERVIISRWIVQEDLVLNSIGFHPDVLRSKAIISREAPSWSGPFYKGGKESELRLLISDQFTKKVVQEADYRLSAAIAEHYLGRMSGLIDGVLFPSIAASLAGDNIALKRASALSKIRFDGAFDVEISEIRENFRFVSNIVATSNDCTPEGEIRWNVGEVPSFWLFPSFEED